MKYLFIIIILIDFNISLALQEEHKYKEEYKKQDQEEHDHSGMNGMNMNMMQDHDMSSSTFIGIPMTMEGSGTSWQPESSPMFMSMYYAGNWTFNLHGDIKIRYDHQGSPRGEKGLSSPNWLMASTHTEISHNTQLMFRTMVSIDRITEGGEGYSLLLQTGETWQNRPLIDRQHPHDLVGELSIGLSQRFSDDFTGFLYFGYPGEPALGPPAYLHRLSAMPLPDAPLGHHWQDATHIVFGAGTTGLIYKRFKIEGSIFTGEEPNENRYDFDKPTFNSFSARISFSPMKDITLQVSTGLLKNAVELGENLQRTTASAMYTTKYSSKTFWATSLVWGMNKEEKTDYQNSLLLESSFFFTDNRVFSRMEYVQKPRKELGIEIIPNKLEDISALSLGYSRCIISFIGIDLDLGAQGTVDFISSFLEDMYGKTPFSYQLYLGLHPSLMVEGM